MAIDISKVDAAVIAIVGEALTYTPFGGSATPISGLWQDPDETPETGELDFITSGPVVFALTSDVPAPTLQDLLTRDLTGQAYNVKNWELDEGALVVLDLEKLP